MVTKIKLLNKNPAPTERLPSSSSLLVVQSDGGLALSAPDQLHPQDGHDHEYYKTYPESPIPLN